VYQTEKVLREQGDKVGADERAAVEGPLDDLKKAIGGDDVDAIKSATERLVTASQSFSQKLYEAASQEQGASAGATSSATAANDDEIVDAEIVDDEKSA
jgi:molecular chaperone DnaK